MDDQLKILRRMEQAAEDNDKDTVLDLNKEFEKLHLSEKPGMDENLALELDRTRQSIVGSVTMIHLRDTFLADAHARLDTLEQE